MNEDPNPENEGDATLGQFTDYALANSFDAIQPGEGYGAGSFVFDENNYFDNEMYAWL